LVQTSGVSEKLVQRVLPIFSGTWNRNHYYSLEICEKLA